MEEPVPEHGEVSALVERHTRENSRSALITTLAWFRDLMLSVLIAVLVILFL